MFVENAYWKVLICKIGGVAWPVALSAVFFTVRDSVSFISDFMSAIQHWWYKPLWEINIEYRPFGLILFFFIFGFSLASFVSFWALLKHIYVDHGIDENKRRLKKKHFSGSWKSIKTEKRKPKTEEYEETKKTTHTHKLMTLFSWWENVSRCEIAMWIINTRTHFSRWKIQTQQPAKFLPHIFGCKYT